METNILDDDGNNLIGEFIPKKYETTEEYINTEDPRHTILITRKDGKEISETEKKRIIEYVNGGNE